VNPSVTTSSIGRGLPKRLWAIFVAAMIALGGALFVDVEADIFTNGVHAVFTRGFTGLSGFKALEAIVRPYAAIICVLVLPPTLEHWGEALLGSRERGTRLTRYSLVVALIIAGFWHPSFA
jgi:hypothetical protein